MAHQVIARKWRPETFDDVVGQRLVTKTLKNSIASGRVAHAFVFSGIRGVGKTTTARILAKALNCRRTDAPTAKPCVEADEDRCDSCREIWESRSVDVQEIDAASHTGVENIRETILASVQYGAARDRFKIFIIDEVHMLSKSAFNALLKTLEEPPAHVKFILATTEPERIPATIMSRCQHYEFKPIAFTEIVKRLEAICSREKIEISDWGIQAVALTARGSMRDAQTTMDRVIALAGDRVSDEDVRTLLGAVDEQHLHRIVECVVTQRRQDLLEHLEHLSALGFEASDLCQKLMTYVANLMVIKVAGWKEELLAIPEALREPMSQQTSEFSELDLIRFYDVLNRVSVELRWHAQPRIHLEMALMKLVEVAQLPRIEEVLARLEKPAGARLADGPSAGRRPATARDEPRGSSPVESRPAASAGGGTSGSERGAVAPERASERGSPAGGTVPAKGLSGVELVERLQSDLSREHPSFYEVLQHSSSIRFESGKLMIAFPPSEFSFFKLVESPERTEILQAGIRKIAGVECRVQLVLEPEGGSRQVGRTGPGDEPEIQKFLKQFPGKISVEKQFGEWNRHENEEDPGADEAGSGHAGEA